jgi:nitrate reductase NapAB chaperone NapD
MFHQLNQLNNLLEEITGNEVDIEIAKGKILITITENKRGVSIPDPDNVKLLDMDDELNDLHDFVSSLPTEI